MIVRPRSSFGAVLDPAVPRRARRRRYLISANFKMRTRRRPRVADHHAASERMSRTRFKNESVGGADGLQHVGCAWLEYFCRFVTRRLRIQEKLPRAYGLRGNLTDAGLKIARSVPDGLKLDVPHFLDQGHQGFRRQLSVH